MQQPPNIDAIARSKGRTVLYVVFHTDALQPLDWRHLPARARLVAWLDARRIGWAPCAHVASAVYTVPYRGQVYIDLPFDKGHPDFCALHAFLERPDGSAALPGAHFCFHAPDDMPGNAHHDLTHLPGRCGAWCVAPDAPGPLAPRTGP